MDSISPAIGSKLTLPAAKTYYDRSSGVTFRPVFPTPRPSKLNRICKTIRANAESESAVAIDFSDPDWKSKYQKDFETRFHIPHLTDAFDDAVSYPSTFCLKMRFMVHLLDIVASQWAYATLTMFFFPFLKSFLIPRCWTLTAVCGIIA